MKDNKVREKRKILFSKCEVIVQKIENPTINGQLIYSNTITFQKGEEIVRDERVVSRVGKGGRELKCLSPLGFYYYKSESSLNNKKKYQEEGIRKVYRIEFQGGYYEISYLTNRNNTSIGHEIRPWDLIGNGIEDHLISDLEKVMNNIVAFLHENKYDEEKINEFKHDCFCDLFGSPEGVKTQTNEGKILAHGFDLKTSFRKRKES